MQLILPLGSDSQTSFCVPIIPAFFNREVELPVLFHLPISLQGPKHYWLSPAATCLPSNEDLVSLCQGSSLLYVFSSSQILSSAVPTPVICLFYRVFISIMLLFMEIIFCYFANCLVNFDSSSLLSHTFNSLFILDMW